jgi:hypothetical protein
VAGSQNVSLSVHLPSSSHLRPLDQELIVENVPNPIRSGQTSPPGNEAAHSPECKMLDRRRAAVFSSPVQSRRHPKLLIGASPLLSASRPPALRHQRFCCGEVIIGAPIQRTSNLSVIAVIPILWASLCTGTNTRSEKLVKAMNCGRPPTSQSPKFPRGLSLFVRQSGFGHRKSRPIKQNKPLN